MTPRDVLKQLEKHEEECTRRYTAIQDQLKALDNRLWGIVVLIIVATGIERLF